MITLEEAGGLVLGYRDELQDYWLRDQYRKWHDVYRVGCLSLAGDWALDQGEKPGETQLRHLERCVSPFHPVAGEDFYDSLPEDVARALDVILGCYAVEIRGTTRRHI